MRGNNEQQKELNVHSFPFVVHFLIAEVEIAI
jgi:hypothetical protein